MQWVKALLLRWLGSLLWHWFDPQSGNLLHAVGEAKKKKKKRYRLLCYTVWARERSWGWGGTWQGGHGRKGQRVGTEGSIGQGVGRVGGLWSEEQERRLSAKGRGSGSFRRGTVERNSTCNHKDTDSILASLSGLRIWCWSSHCGSVVNEPE